jgi:hypothetical protein
MFESIKNRIFERRLKKQLTLVRRDVKNKSFDELESILFFFDCRNEEKYVEFERIYNYCKDRGKSIRAIGYTNMKHQAHFCAPRINFEYVLVSHYNSMGVPTAGWVDELMKNEYDVLIDLSHCMHKSFHWLIALSQSKCKVGAADVKCDSLYDITIDTENEPSQRYLMQQAIIYLNMLKNKTQ